MSSIINMEQGRQSFEKLISGLSSSCEIERSNKWDNIHINNDNIICCRLKQLTY